eukprot:COSAG02_NODE_59799_length_273_cov_0.597701_1_plen_23_part_10
MSSHTGGSETQPIDTMDDPKCAT